MKSKPTQQKHALRGVNFGGWLLLEPWMTPSVFRGTTAKDEYSLASLGKKYHERIEKHRSTFITEDDFRWLAQHNVEAIRIPIGYWALRGDTVYLNATEHLDWAMKMAGKYNLKVLISIHGAPGGQNKKHHSGRIEKLGWFWPKNFLQLIAFMKKIVCRYSDNSAFWGISLLNEPRSSGILSLFLKLYYHIAIQYIQKNSPKLYIVISDGFNAKRWKNTARRHNATLDLHIYQSFSAFEKKKNIKWHITRTKENGEEIISLLKTCAVVVGEWSAVLHPSCKEGYTEAEQQQLIKQYVATQMKSYNHADAWFYWSYKTEGGGSWSFRDMVDGKVISLGERARPSA